MSESPDVPAHVARVVLPAANPAVDSRVVAVIESISDAFLALDSEWRVVYANREAARLSGVTPMELVGRSHWEEWPWTLGSEVERQYRRAVESQTPVHFEQFYSVSGVWHSIHAYPAEDGGLAIFYRDITAAKRVDVEREELLDAAQRARADAERANLAKSRFVAAMSHELRTPLNAIQGYVQLLEMELYGTISERQREVLARIARAEAHLHRLINDVLDYARIESGRTEYDIRPVELRDVIASVAPMIEPQLAARAIAYEVRVPGKGAVVWADHEKLVQVLLNLLSNAAKFTAEGGRITVDLATRADGTQAPGVVYLRVTDTGIGIPGEQLDAVFEPFVQVGPDPAQREGAGLGLAISRDLARGMGGDLRVRSTVGAGSTFTLTLRSATWPAHVGESDPAA